MNEKNRKKMIDVKYKAMLMREKQRQLPPAMKERMKYTHK